MAMSTSSYITFLLFIILQVTYMTDKINYINHSRLSLVTGYSDFNARWRTSKDKMEDSSKLVKINKLYLPNLCSYNDYNYDNCLLHE